MINRERKGDYLGKTVQVVPHITDAIQDWIERVAHVSLKFTLHLIIFPCLTKHEQVQRYLHVLVSTFVSYV